MNCEKEQQVLLVRSFFVFNFWVFYPCFWCNVPPQSSFSIFNQLIKCLTFLYINFYYMKIPFNIITFNGIERIFRILYVSGNVWCPRFTEFFSDREHNCQNSVLGLSLLSSVFFLQGWGSGFGQKTGSGALCLKRREIFKIPLNE